MFPCPGDFYVNCCCCSLELGSENMLTCAVEYTCTLLHNTEASSVHNAATDVVRFLQQLNGDCLNHLAVPASI